MKGRSIEVARRALILGALATGLALAAAPGLAAQGGRRGVQQRPARTTPGRAERDAQNPRSQRQGQLLLDRFAQRVGQALHLEQGTTERLLRELQGSRAARGRISAQVAGIRRELGQLIQESPADQEQIGALMEELFDLEVRRAEVARDEQRRLSEFLTPLERARVIWLRQRLARQAAQQGTDRPIPY